MQVKISLSKMKFNLKHFNIILSKMKFSLIIMNELKTLTNEAEFHIDATQIDKCENDFPTKEFRFDKN